MFKPIIKTKNEIELMRKGGKILGEMLHTLQEMSVAGLDSWALEEKFIEMCEKYNVTPACKGYAPHGFSPFPTGLCFNINDQVVHNQPKKGLKLQEGQIITLDTVIKYKGFYLDSAVSYGIGEISEKDKRFLNVVKQALYDTIELVKPGTRVGDLSNSMQTIAEKNGYSVLMEYAGHGIGRKMHEVPEIPCYGQKNTGPILKSGMTLAIEPLICEKSSKITHRNFWDTNTQDGGNFAQFEHTVLVTDSGYEILTSHE